MRSIERLVVGVRISLLVTLFTLSAQRPHGAQAQFLNLQDVIAANERAIAQSEAWAPNCRDGLVRREIYDTAAMARSLLENMKVYQGSVSAADLISPITTMINQLTQAIQSCIKIMAEDTAIHTRCNTPIHIGMTASKVLKSDWCEPSHINKTITSGHTYEQWVYEGARISNEHEGYLYFEDSVLTAIQTK